MSICTVASSSARLVKYRTKYLASSTGAKSTLYHNASVLSWTLPLAQSKSIASAFDEPLPAIRNTDISRATVDSKNLRITLIFLLVNNIVIFLFFFWSLCVYTIPHNKSGCKITTFFQLCKQKILFLLKISFLPIYTHTHTTLHNPTPYYITRAHARKPKPTI